jgi:hypothetical protein
MSTHTYSVGWRNILRYLNSISLGKKHTQSASTRNQKVRFKNLSETFRWDDLFRQRKLNRLGFRVPAFGFQEEVQVVSILPH